MKKRMLAQELQSRRSFHQESEPLENASKTDMTNSKTEANLASNLATLARKSQVSPNDANLKVNINFHVNF